MGKGKSTSPASPSSRESIDVREIDNGYIVAKSGYDSKGNYKSCETYTPTKPEVLIGAASRPRALSKQSALGAAISHVKRK